MKSLRCEVSSSLHPFESPVFSRQNANLEVVFFLLFQTWRYDRRERQVGKQIVKLKSQQVVKSSSFIARDVWIINDEESICWFLLHSGFFLAAETDSNVQSISAPDSMCMKNENWFLSTDLRLMNWEESPRDNVNRCWSRRW